MFVKMHDAVPYIHWGTRRLLKQTSYGLIRSQGRALSAKERGKFLVAAFPPVFTLDEVKNF